MLRRRLSTYFTVLAAVTLTGAGWSWWNALSARAPLGALESQVPALRQEVSQLAALPDLPPLPRLTETLQDFLGHIEPPLMVRFANAVNKNTSAEVPNMTGVRLVVLEVTDPKPTVELPQVSLARVAGWQGRWPLQVTQAVWNSKAVTATLTLYGR